MTRIIAGSARGRRLAVPAAGTRPTSDRAREALFSAVESLLGGPAGWEGLRTLDLFAGSGAVGLEALSRGGTEAVLVESAPQAAKVIAANIATLALPGARLVTAPVARFLAGDARDRAGFVFADPPYATAADEVQGTLVTLAERGWLERDAVVVVERATRGSALAWPPEFIPLRNRAYGDATLWFATWSGGAV